MKEKFQYVLPLLFTLSAPPVSGDVPPGMYRTKPGAMVQVSGDLVPNGSETRPLTATLTVKSQGMFASLEVNIKDAVRESGPVSDLVVLSNSGVKAEDGSYSFSGDYLEGTQYCFSWNIFTLEDGTIVCNGDAGWCGGRLWNVSFESIELVAMPKLEISQRSRNEIEIGWHLNAAEYVLERSSSLGDDGWEAVAGSVSTDGERFYILIDVVEGRRFYRLREPEPASRTKDETHIVQTGSQDSPD